MLDWLRELRKSDEEKRQEAITAYLDGALTPGQRRHLERQIADDPALRAEVEQQRLIKETLGRMPRIVAPRNFTLDPSVYGAAERREATVLYPALRVATAVAAIVFVVALVLDVYIVDRFSSSTLEVPVAAQITQEVEEEIVVEGEAAQDVIEEPPIPPMEAPAAAEAEPVEEEAAEEPAEAEMAAEIVAEESVAEESQAPVIEEEQAEAAMVEAEATKVTEMTAEVGAAEAGETPVEDGALEALEAEATLETRQVQREATPRALSPSPTPMPTPELAMEAAGDTPTPALLTPPAIAEQAEPQDERIGPDTGAEERPGAEEPVLVAEPRAEKEAPLSTLLRFTEIVFGLAVFLLIAAMLMLRSRR